MLIPRRSTLPGPRLPRAVQGVRFLASEHRMLQRYRRRYGDVFALKVWPFDPLVVIGDPETSSGSSPATRRSCTRARATRCSGPSSARTRCSCSTSASTCARRKLLLPPFHGERMRVYGDVMRELAEAEVATLARRRAVPAAAGDAAADAADHPAHGLRASTRARAWPSSSGRSVALTRRRHADHAVPLLQRDWGPGSPQRRFEAARAEVDAMLARRDRAPPRVGRARRRRALDAARRARRGRLGADRGELRDHLITLLLAGHETTATQLVVDAASACVRHPRGAWRAPARRRSRAATSTSTRSSRRASACARCSPT